MSTTLQIKIEPSVTPVTVYFSGAIDEDSNFSNLDSINCSEMILDLDGVTFINSCGIREWIKYQDQMSSSLKIIYRKCPQVIIEQMNIVKGFIKTGGMIESFYAPYYHEAKDQELKILLSPLDIINSKAPIRKSEDGDELEFDDIESQYFNFLKYI